MNYNFKYILLFSLVVFIFSCNSSKPISPNIVLINIDDLGYNDTSIYGSNYYETPNIDQLAEEGILFTNAYAGGANCTPSRACLLTGMNMQWTGVYAVGSSTKGPLKEQKLIPIKNGYFDDELVTIAEELKKMDYVTACIGKYDFGKDPKRDGFDNSIAGGILGFPMSFFSPYKFLRKHMEDGPKGEYLTDRITSEAIQWISSNKTNKFFLYLSYFSVHSPIEAKQEIVKKYSNKQADKYQNNPIYAGMIETLDTNIGLLLSYLQENNLENNTLVIFTSDNGGIFSNHPLRGVKGVYYEGGIKIPLIIKYPNEIQKNRTLNTLVSHIDIYPTILDFVGIKEPLNKHLEGISLKEQKSINSNRSLFWHFPIYLHGKADSGGVDTLFRQRPGSAIRKGEWKLLEYFENGNIELYNLKKDISEKHDVSKQFPQKTKELHNLLIGWRSFVNAPVPTRLNPKYDPKHKF